MAGQLKTLIQKANSIKKELTDLLANKSDVELINIKKGNKLYKNRYNALKKINAKILDIKKQSIGILESISDQESGIKSLGNLYAPIQKIEKSRVSLLQSVNTSIADNISKLTTIQSINQEIAELTSTDVAQRAILQTKFEDELSNLDGRGAGMAKQISLLKQSNDLANTYANLTEIQKDQLESQIEAYTTIQKTISGTLETASLLTSNWNAAVGAVLAGLGYGLNTLVDTNKELGITLSETSLVSAEAAGLSFIFDDTIGTVKQLTAELGSTNAASFGMQTNIGLMASTMGITNTEAVSLVANFARLNGGSTEIAANMVETTRQFALQNNVIPSDVMSDLAQSTEEFALYGKAGGDNMIKAAVGAAKLGVSLSTLTGIADTLLDFESSITNEMELSALLGKNINLNKARQLAYDGDIEAASREALKQVGGIAAFNKMDYFQRKKTADVLGISVAQLKKMADNQQRIGETGLIVDKTFDKIGASVSAISNKYLGHGLEILGGWVTTTGQIGLGMQHMGLSLKGILSSMGNIIKKAGSKAWTFITGRGGSIANNLPTGAAPRSPSGGITQKMKDATGTGKGGIKTGKLLKGAAAMLVVAASVFVFAKALQELEKIKDWESIAIGLGAFAASMGVIGLVGTNAGIGLSAIGEGLKAFGKAMMGPGGLGLAALTIAAIGLGYALKLAAPGIEAFGTVVTSVFNGMGTLVTAAAAGFVSILNAVTPDKIMAMGALGLSLLSVAAGLTAIGVAGMLALPALSAINAIGVVGSTIKHMVSAVGINEDQSGVDANSNIAKYQSDSLMLLREIKEAILKTKDVYMDKEKVSRIVTSISDRQPGNRAFVSMG